MSITETSAGLDVTIPPQIDDGAGAYPRPLNEDARLHALHALNILDTPPDERFDRIVRLAAKYFRVPMVRITFVDHDRTWYKARVGGSSSSEGPRDIGICSHTIMTDDVLVTHDLTKDCRFRNSPQVVGGAGLRFYAGAPITLDEGMRVGSICIIDVKPHPDFSDDDREFLKDLAQIVVDELELHKQIANRDASLKNVKRQVAAASNAKKRFMDVIGHELRTPLVHVLGFSKILADQQFGELGNRQYVDHARSLYRSAEQLEGLIERVLHYSSAEVGELRLAETAFELKALTAKCLELVGVRSQVAGVEVVLSLDEQAARSIFADEVQISEAVVQMLDKAISVSTFGTVVELNICSSQEGGVCIRILDRGPGVETNGIAKPENLLSGDIGEVPEPAGSDNLSLSVARAVFELHGGNLHIIDRPGGGAVVEAVLPVYRNR